MALGSEPAYGQAGAAITESFVLLYVHDYYGPARETQPGKEAAPLQAQF